MNTIRKVPFVDLKSQYISIKDEIDKAIYNVISETAFIGGKYVKNFEEAFKSLYGVKHCIGVGNGTDSLYIIMKMLGIREGDEVITSAYSWISSSETISQTGAKPVFVDIDEFYTINANMIEAKITPRTKAIIPVHIHGQVCDMSKLKAICDKHKLFLIEDCAQSHFSQYGAQRVGTIGIAASFSFYPGKNLGAYGDAGCILTNDDNIASAFRMYANHGALVKHAHKIEGINSRLDALQASILTAKLPYILGWTASRQKNAGIYTSLLQSVEDIELPAVRVNTSHTFHLYVIKTSRRDELKAYLGEKGIETAVHYPTALPNLECYRHLDLKQDDYPVATGNQQMLLSLPMYPELTQDDIEYVTGHIMEFFKIKK
ncbi:erythromycin biosynthesis sensory transduction protein eryC1 [Chitinophaga alhagiae]|uniref:Erythromycin biosynthesis sensory transduction protein eryC1 n=1 Tax=Chitinophaga alhagiae TaxID=2203219 RepID=A0ABN5LTZ4_9BACT|nr:DegT/DnrJ/EryC1/StrS family aminotransferase [Chitinophaga alhagiae]AWO01183.1 erythromycin biosynthesis sensory transduction protein eryC1 [Chitinophaga alhagiae]